ncbi:MAG: transglycosylase domain-containing protein, partial [Chloroflexi bacterium]|nr:transglycosylase domain-containing protein [Chloroflexota bacterium]
MSKFFRRNSSPDSEFPLDTADYSAPDASQRFPADRASFAAGLMHFLTIAGLLGIIITCLLLVGGVAVYAYFTATLPSPDRLEGRAQSQSTKILDRNGELLYEVFDLESMSGGRRTIVPINKIPQVLKQATLATEDPTFYTNPGVDFYAILRAVYYDVRYGRIVSGGSTITQQLVKLTLLTPEVTIQRKIYEAFLAYQVTRQYPKDKILEFYFNSIFFGNQSYGIEAAANTYFNKHAEELTLGQASLLAGIPQAPALYDPCTNASATLGRQRVVLNLMIKENYIAPPQADAAAVETEKEIKSDAFKRRCTQGVGIKAPHFVTYIRELLEDQYGTEIVYQGGLNVTTTLDMKMQRIAEEEARKQIASLAAQKVTNASLIAINPKTGEILAMLGSVDFFDEKIDGQVNVALALRQPGSSIKPLNYVAAFEKGWNPATVLSDVKTNFPIKGQPDYVPNNYDQR